MLHLVSTVYVRRISCHFVTSILNRFKIFHKNIVCKIIFNTQLGSVFLITFGKIVLSQIQRLIILTRASADLYTRLYAWVRY